MIPPLFLQFWPAWKKMNSTNENLKFAASFIASIVVDISEPLYDRCLKFLTAWLVTSYSSDTCASHTFTLVFPNSAIWTKFADNEDNMQKTLKNCSQSSWRISLAEMLYVYIQNATACAHLKWMFEIYSLSALSSSDEK